MMNYFGLERCGFGCGKNAPLHMVTNKNLNALIYDASKLSGKCIDGVRFREEMKENDFAEEYSGCGCWRISFIKTKCPKVLDGP